MDNPYHNAIHAVDVTNNCSFFIINGMKKYFSEF